MGDYSVIKLYMMLIYLFIRLAVKHMASSLAVEWAKKGVRVNVLRHGGNSR